MKDTSQTPITDTESLDQWAQSRERFRGLSTAAAIKKMYEGAAATSDQQQAAAADLDKLSGDDKHKPAKATKRKPMVASGTKGAVLLPTPPE